EQEQAAALAPRPEPTPAPPPKPQPEYLDVLGLPASVVCVQQLVWPTPRLDGSVRGMFVLVLAGEAAALGERLGLPPSELCVAPAGAFAGRAVLVVGEATPVGPDERGNLIYGADRLPGAYPLAAAAGLTRTFARPKQLADQAALRKAAAEAD